MIHSNFRTHDSEIFNIIVSLSCFFIKLRGIKNKKFNCLWLDKHIEDIYI